MVRKDKVTCCKEEEKTNYCLSLTLRHIKRVDTIFPKTNNTMYFSRRVVTLSESICVKFINYAPFTNEALNERYST